MDKGLFYLKCLGKKSNAGNVLVKIGELCLDNHEWGVAIQSINEGILKGGLDDAGYAYRLLAKCYMKIGRHQLAGETLLLASEYQ